MKRLLLLLLVPLACAAQVPPVKPWKLHADPVEKRSGVSINLDNVRIDQLANLVFGDILKANFIIDSALIKREDAVRIHIDLPDDAAKAKPLLLQVLKSAGVAVEENAGVYILRPAEDGKGGEGAEPFVYRPKYRAVSYLQDLVAGFFKPGAFAYQRGVQNGQTVPPPSGQPQPAETGTNAYSVIDKVPDTLVFRGSANDVDKLQKLLAELDTLTPEIMVKAVVFEVSTDNIDSSALSLAASLLGGRLGLRLGNATAGDYSAVFKNASLHLIADVLSSDRRFKLVSSPQLRVMSGASAKLTVGSETPVLGQATLDKNGNPVQSVDYKQSGVILNLLPQIRGEVTELKISQQISNFIQTTTGVNGSPTLNTREISTSVSVGSGDVLILGGMNQDQVTTQHQGLPFLPAWLRSSAEVKTRSEVLLILQAQRI